MGPRALVVRTHGGGGSPRARVYSPQAAFRDAFRHRAASCPRVFSTCVNDWNENAVVFHVARRKPLRVCRLWEMAGATASYSYLSLIHTHSHARRSPLQIACLDLRGDA